MSGPRISPEALASAAPRSSRPACGSAFAGASSELPRFELKNFPADIASSASKAIAATAQGSGDELDLRGSPVVVAPGDVAPTGFPQR